MTTRIMRARNEGAPIESDQTVVSNNW